MATSCPCGCGRPLGFTRRGAAAGYRRAEDLRVRLEKVATEATRELAPPSDQAGIIERSPQQAANVRDELLEHCHGTASPTQTSDQLTLSRMLSTLDELAAQLEAVVRR